MGVMVPLMISLSQLCVATLMVRNWIRTSVSSGVDAA